MLCKRYHDLPEVDFDQKLATNKNGRVLVVHTVTEFSIYTTYHVDSKDKNRDIIQGGLFIRINYLNFTLLQETY